MAAAAGVVAVVDVMLALTPLVLFAVAVALSTARGGTKPGLLAAGLAALVSNYLFVHPRYELSFDSQVAWLIALYLASVPLARLAVTRLRRVATHRETTPAGATVIGATGLLIPLLIATCALTMVCVAVMMHRRGYAMPVPTGVVAGLVLFGIAAWRWRGRY